MWENIDLKKKEKEEKEKKKKKNEFFISKNQQYICASTSKYHYNITSLVQYQ